MVSGVRPASRPCVRKGLPSARFQEARQFFLRRSTREGSEGRCRGLGSSVEVLNRLLNHCRIFDARNHLDRTTPVFTDHRSLTRASTVALKVHRGAQAWARRQARHHAGRAWPASPVHAADGSARTPRNAVHRITALELNRFAVGWHL